MKFVRRSHQDRKENLSWGYDRIQGTLANLGHPISDSTVGNILRQNGIGCHRRSIGG